MKLESERSSTARDGTNSASAPSFARAGSQPRAARSGVFSSSLEALGERLNPSTWFAREAGRTPKAAVSRLREVLDRDRALVAANPELNELDDAPQRPEEPTVAPDRAAAPVTAKAPAPARAIATAPAADPSPPRPALPPAPAAPAAPAAAYPFETLDEPFAPARPRAAAPLGAFSEGPLSASVYEPRRRAAPPAAVVSPSAPAAPAAPSVVASRVVMVCNEPIRTRTMARLLASQGHRERALSIYEYLLSRGSNDESLRAEADALRSEPA